MAAAHGNGGGTAKVHTKWAYFHRVPVGYRTVPMRGPGGTIPKNAGQRVIVWGKGAWVKVGSPRFKKVTSYVGPHGHQAVIASQYKIGHIRPDLRPPSHSLPGSARVKGPGNEVAGRNSPKAPTQTKGPVKNPIGNQGRGGGGGGGPKKTSAVNTRILGAQLGSAKVGKMQGKGAATAQADLQFGAQIADAKTNKADQAAQGNQDLQDITNWYTQIAGVNNAAKASNDQAVSGATAAANAATAKVLAAIGGGANVGAGAVGAAGNDNAAMLQALGAGQDAYQNNLSVGLAQNQAGQMQAQMALNSQGAQAAQQALSDLQGQRSSAIQANLASILQQNNALAETRFNNQIAKQQEVQAAVSLLGNQRLQGAQIQAQQIANRAATGGKTSGFVPWGQLTANDKYGLVQQLMAPGANGKAPTYQQALARGHSLGYAPSNLAPYLGSFFGQ